MEAIPSYFGRLLPLYVVIFIGFIGYSLTITIFTPLLLNVHNGFIDLGVTSSTRFILLGILLAMYPLGQFLGSPVMGALSDRFGRKPMLLASLAATALCYLVIISALLSKNLILLGIACFVAGLAEANIVLAQAAIADLGSPKDRSRLFGYLYLSASLAYIIGPLLGGKLADPTFVSWFNDATPFAVVFIFLLAVLVWITIKFDETRALVTTEISYFQAFTNLKMVTTDRRVRALHWINFLFYLAIFGFFTCYPMYLVNEYHMGVSKESEFIAWVAVPIVLANIWLTGIFAKHYSARTMAITTAIATGFFTILIVIPSNENYLWITLFLAGLAVALCMPFAASNLSLAVDESKQGQVMGNNQALQVLATSVAGAMGGLLAAFSIKLALVLLGIVAILAAIFLLFKTVNISTTEA